LAVPSQPEGLCMGRAWVCVPVLPSLAAAL
jgi:hypothetical protein